jgi:hypothetical protein
MSTYKPDDKDQVHEFAEATPAPASLAADSVVVAGASGPSPTAAAVCAPMAPLPTCSS